MSVKLFQSIINQFKGTIGRTVGILDDNGAVIASSDASEIGSAVPDVREELTYTPDILHYGGRTYKALGNGPRVEYAVYAEGEDAESDRLCAILSVTFRNVRDLYSEKYDKSSFIKNVMLSNILPGDIYSRAKELHVPTDSARAVLIIKLPEPNDIMAYQLVQNMFPDRNKDYVFCINDDDIVLVKEIKSASETAEAEKIASQISDTLNTEYITGITIGIGNIAKNLRELPRSYKEANVSIEIGRVFETEKNIINYKYLGISRLVYQLPAELCELFLSEVAEHGSFDTLDHETLLTVQCFFANNLNISETARKLFIHRNTLVYRLEKIKKITGLDLRDFDSAITFKVALMVRKYLSSKTEK